MSQDTAELRAELDRCLERARRHRWVPPPPAPVEVRLTSLGSPSDVTFEPVLKFVSSFREITGVALGLRGGGFGCVDLAFTAETGSPGSDPSKLTAARVEAAITNSATAAALNSLEMDAVQVRTPDATQVFRAFNDLQMGIATNRKQIASVSAVVDDIRGLFGAENASTTTYGMAEVSVSDLSRNQPKQNIAKRAWRRVKTALGFTRQPTILVRKLNLYKRADFPSALEPHLGKGAVLVVHGYANTFDQALDSCALSVHRARLQTLGFLPVAFSWPAGGSPVQYLKDTKKAENSELRLLETLDLLTESSGGHHPSVIAHSHGNKLLVRSLTTLVSGRVPKSRWLKRLVLVEPDVDQEFLEGRVAELAEAADRIVVYHSENDRALKAAEIIFAGVRAGQSGIHPDDLDTAIAQRLEVVDARAVAAGWTRHAPHIESPEVITDLHHLFEGKDPKDRLGLAPISTARWELHSPTDL